MSGLEQSSSEEQIENTEESYQEDNINDSKPEISEVEQKALNDGWMPKDDWVSKGRDPDDWVSAKKFNERGELYGALKANQKQIEEMRRDFDDRLKANKKLQEIQMKARIAELEQKRDEAVENADVENYKKVQSDIDDLNNGINESFSETEISADQKELNKYNEANPWLYDNSPKSIYAKAQFLRYESQGNSIKECIRLMENDLNREFPEINRNRENAPPTEKNRSRPGTTRNKSLQWSDLTSEELNWFKFGEFKDKDQYLKIVQDERSARG